MVASQPGTDESRSIEDHRPSVSRCCGIRKDLARPLPEPAVGELDLPDRHTCRGRRGRAAGRGNRSSSRRCRPRAASGRPTPRSPRSRGARPGGNTRAAPATAWAAACGARDHSTMTSCLPTYRPRCRSFAFTPCSSMSPSSRGFRHAEYCSHSALPQRDRLLGGVELAVRGRLRLARIAAGELGVQMRDLFAHDLGDGRALARREIRGGERAQLAAHRLVERRDGRDQKRLGPALGPVRVRECERRNGVRPSGFAGIVWPVRRRPASGRKRCGPRTACPSAIELPGQPPVLRRHRLCAVGEAPLIAQSRRGRSRRSSRRRWVAGHAPPGGERQREYSASACAECSLGAADRRLVDCAVTNRCLHPRGRADPPH